jgi:hypothetical protein
MIAINVIGGSGEDAAATQRGDPITNEDVHPAQP